jgi:hypothetical protein
MINNGFRVWDNKMLSYFSEDFLISHKGDLLAYHPILSGWYAILNINELKVERCTGVVDIKGFFVFDGDIIKVVNQDTKDILDQQVAYIWSDDMNCRWIKFKDKELSWNDFCILIDYDGTLVIEVIGNVNENIELVKDFYQG